MTLYGFLEPDAGKLARPVLRGERTRKGSALPDWSLIGARKWTNPDGEELILHRGHAYRRRELEAVDNRKMKLPAAVKYSRGAKNTDPDHVREKADGEFEYVTLAIFRGGKRQERFAVPGQRNAQPRTTTAERTA